MFFMKHTPIFHLKWVKITLVFVSIILAAYLIFRFNAFTVYLEELGIQNFLSHLSHDDYMWYSKYIRTQMILFGTGAIISAVLFPFAMIRSIWLQFNSSKE